MYWFYGKRISVPHDRKTIFCFPSHEKKIFWLRKVLKKVLRTQWKSQPSTDLTRLILLFNGKLVLLFQTYNIILYVHTFLFCWHFSYRTCTFCKACSDWLQLPLAALHINRHRVTSKIRLTMPRVKISRADHNPWLAKMLGVQFCQFEIVDS